MELENIKTIEDFDKWKDMLHKVVRTSRKVGMKEDTITDIAKKVGDYLHDHIDPENPEQRLLKQLWDVGTQEERHSLAHMIVKMVDKEVH